MSSVRGWRFSDWIHRRFVRNPPTQNLPAKERKVVPVPANEKREGGSSHVVRVIKKPSSSSSSKPTALRSFDCVGPEVVPDILLGQGSYGSVWSLRPIISTGKRWILKVSNLDGDAERTESYEREVYFLKRLQGSGVVPELKLATICNGQGIQLMERFDGSFQDLGEKQGLKHGLKRKQVAVTQEQLDSLIATVHRFDQFGIIHGDGKRGNFLYADEGKRVVVADFGFAGARNTPYYPLLGFVRNYKCPAAVIKTKDGFTKLETRIPKNLVPFINRWEIYIDIVGGRQTFIIPKNAKSRLKQIKPATLAKALGLTKDILKAFQTYCPDAPL